MQKAGLKHSFFGGVMDTIYSLKRKSAQGYSCNYLRLYKDDRCKQSNPLEQKAP